MNLKTTFALTCMLSLFIMLSCKKDEPETSTNSSKQVATDIDGNAYTQLNLFGEVWLQRNLEVSHFNNGDPIPHAPTNQEWEDAIAAGQPAWCWYDNDFANNKKYGKIYNVFAVRDPRGVAPEGWHVATNSDWQGLINSLGGDTLAADKLKSETGWGWNSIGGSNSVLFNGLPAGERSISSEFAGEGEISHWWSFDHATQGEGNSSFLIINYPLPSFTFQYTMGQQNKGGNYIRCVKN